MKYVDVIELDDYRPHVAERQQCTACGRMQISVHLASLNCEMWECMHCRDLAAVSIEVKESTP